ncbi:5-oxoprolinase/urea amidolyase family protein [Clostridium sp. MCC353]|uniref:5-oxoprolinase subunit C family protein n=1 Tax=Clostridium sp. MCC353 TaxID=2592646 RepID=UPI001C02BE77|nr:biotin-dependent carboxyltransferase family protein [Clostridium sp. MCC353]MBT9775636.1 5-oxoprolinase/urea amidolyase family protein [Clostridium sp. MCC353]
MSIYIEEAGILTTIQDGGRLGYQKYGVSPAGPMDPRSFYLANLLAGNKKEEGALELTYAGVKMRFGQANVIAVTGGDLCPQIDGRPVPMYQAVTVRKGETLAFTGCKNGCRSYVAFAGGLKIPLFLGSKSTLIRNGIGGADGRKLQKGDCLEFENPRETLPDMEKRKLPGEIFPSKTVFLRVVKGPQDDFFTEAGLKQFFWHGGTITSQFDRMGCRLECEKAIEHKKDGNIISDGIAFGSIQVPTNGHPIIMMADRQSTGGYAKIATVITPDLTLLSQCVPGDKLMFVEVGIDTAQLAAIRQINYLNELEQRFYTGI